MTHSRSRCIAAILCRPTDRLLKHGTQTPVSLGDVSGAGKPDCTFGPRRGGENPSVRAGPSPLRKTRTKNRRSTTNWKTSIDLTRIGVEHTAT